MKPCSFIIFCSQFQTSFSHQRYIMPYFTHVFKNVRFSTEDHVRPRQQYRYSDQRYAQLFHIYRRGIVVLKHSNCSPAINYQEESPAPALWKTSKSQRIHKHSFKLPTCSRFVLLFIRTFTKLILRSAHRRQSLCILREAISDCSWTVII